jgi:hypothetical protein
MMVIDSNVAYYIVLLSKGAQVNVKRFYWMIRFHPVIFSSPLGKWWMMRKHMRTVRELTQEMSQKEDSVV